MTPYVILSLPKDLMWFFALYSGYINYQVAGLEGISGGAIGRARNPDLFASFLEEILFLQWGHPLYLAKNL